MPWEDKTVEKSRIEFVTEVIAGEKTMSQLCREYRITRKTGYKWVERFRNGETLQDKSHAPFNTPKKTCEEKEELVLSARDNHPTWGARKLKRYLEDKGETDLPGKSTISDILKRNQRVEPEESIKHIAYKRFVRETPNDLWQTDFKGDFLMVNNERCYPLTVLDDHSRFSLCIDAKENQRAEGVFNSFEQLFQDNGLPYAILCDNGPPWGDTKQGYTPFELWLMKLDILPIHGRPFHPQTQGKEERFHRTLKDDLLKRTPMIDIPYAQKKFDSWRNEYNHERPHESLNLDVPAKHYKASKRKLPDIVSDPEYETGARLRKVNCKGYISINSRRYYFSETFIGKYLELIEDDNDIMKLCYGKFQVAKVDLTEQLIISRKIYRR